MRRVRLRTLEAEGNDDSGIEQLKNAFELSLHPWESPAPQERR
jgi:hypothetical protein